MWISVPVLIIVSGLACMNGLVMYAVYANCDPLTAGEIRLNNQVLLKVINLGRVVGRQINANP